MIVPTLRLGLGLRFPGPGPSFASTAAIIAAGPVYTTDFTTLSALPTGISLSRATTGTYFDASGVLQTAGINAARFDHNPATLAATGFLNEGQRTNLAFPSVPNTSAGWTTNNVAVTNAAATAPDGTTTAIKIVPTGTSVPVLYAPFNSVGVNTFSVFAKAGEYTKASIRLDGTGFGSHFAIFDLSAKTVLSSEAGMTSSIKDEGNGWLRLISTLDVGGTPVDVYSQFGPVDDGYSVGGGTLTLGSFDNTKGVYFWGAPLEVGSFATSYIPTTTAAVTRSADIPSASSPLDGYLAAGPSVWEFQDEATGAIARAAYAAGAFDWPVNKWYRSMGVYAAGTDTSSHMTVGSAY